MRLLSLLVLFLVALFAHEVQENRAKVVVQHQSVRLELSFHENSWTKQFATHALDDAILKQTKLMLNNQTISLKLQKIEKRLEHYTLHCIAQKPFKEKLKSASLILPSTLGNVVVTVVRAKTGYLFEGKRIDFSF